MAFVDPTISHLRRLAPQTQRAAIDMVIHLRNLGVPLWISSSTRTLQQQRRLVSEGASRTLNSKHLTGQAFDVDVLGFARDDVPLWWWQSLARLGNSLGLLNGGRFTGLADWGHFEARR